MSMPTPTQGPKPHDVTTPDAVPGASALDPPRFVEIPGARRKQAMKLWALSAFLLVTLGVMVILPQTNQDTSTGENGTWFAVVGATVMAAAVLVALIFVLISVYMRGKQAAAVAGRPGATGFISQSTPELLAALKAIGIEQPRLGLQPAVTVGREGIELWGPRHASTPRVTLPWEDIAYVHPDHFVIFNGRKSFPALTMRVLHRGSGHLVEMPLPIIGRNGLSFARADRANTLLSAFAQYTDVA